MMEDDDLEPFQRGESASKLKALFASEQKKLQVGNATFQYQPPKPPAKPCKPLSQMQLVFSTELSQVVCISSSGGQETHSNGTVMIVEDEQMQTPRILIRPVLEIFLTECQSLLPDTDCSAVFETKERTVKVKFHSADDWAEFARVFTYARFYATQEATLFQDICLPKDTVRIIEDGDTVQLVYKVSVARHGSKPLFEETSESSLKLHIGSGCLKELEEVIKGMRKGGRRLVMFKDPTKDVSKLYDLHVPRVRKQRLPRKDGDPGSTKPDVESHNVGAPGETEASSSASSLMNERRTESVSDRLARMARAGAAVNLHFFGPPTREPAPVNCNSELERQRNAETDRLGLLLDIKKSQTCIAKAVAELSSKFELLADPKLQHLSLVESEDSASTQSSPEEDTIVDSVAKMIAENRELKRRLANTGVAPTTTITDPNQNSVAKMIAENRELKRRLANTGVAPTTTIKDPNQRTVELLDSSLEGNVERILLEVYKNMESEMSKNQHLEPVVGSSLLHFLEQNLEAAKASILATIPRHEQQQQGKVANPECP